MCACRVPKLFVSKRTKLLSAFFVILNLLVISVSANSKERHYAHQPRSEDFDELADKNLAIDSDPYDDDGNHIENENPENDSLETQTTTAEPNTKPKDNLQNGFLSSFSMILVSEIADKTFFIAAILSGQFNKFIVFSGAFTALILMTVLSVALGQVLLTFLPIEIAELVSNLLFLIFGAISLKDGVKMKNHDDEEFRETAMELKAKGLNERPSDLPNNPNGAGPSTSLLDMEDGSSTSRARARSTRAESSLSNTAIKSLKAVFSKLFLQAFTMTFIAEWGDRSQIATIQLAATKSGLGVCLGGIAGHCICTGLACYGGSILAEKINAKTITIIGGIVFFFFGIYGLTDMHFDGDFQSILDMMK